MNSLSVLENKWNPFREMEELQRRLNAAFGRSPVRRESEEGITVSQWAPLVDIVEDEKEYLIKTEIPEVTRDQVSVKVEKGVLSISGERKLEAEEKDKKYHRVERSYGSFTRTFTLPDDVDDGKVRAEFKDGILFVHLPKSEKAKPKTIDVKVS